jgi:hypothetical protein
MAHLADRREIVRSAKHGATLHAIDGVCSAGKSEKNHKYRAVSGTALQVVV